MSMVLSNNENIFKNLIDPGKISTTILKEGALIEKNILICYK
jgi:hypothetical protein